MKNKSLVYRHIYIYRMIMNVLYKGKYNLRFKYISENIQGTRVIELCFGDIQIANYCRQKGIDWLGYDINETFVNYAIKNNFNATLADLKEIEILPKSDTCIMAGSLYHFHEEAESILQKMLLSSNNIIISEPIINLSSNKGVIGFIARRSASISKKEEFRFEKDSFLSLLQRLSSRLDFRYKIVQEFSKDIIVILNKKTEQKTK